jgi:hypothetical protein
MFLYDFGMSSKDKTEHKNLTDLVSPEALDLLSGSGAKLVEKIGIEVVRGVVLDVLTGKNLRDSTEALTRKRIATLNLALLHMFLNGANNNPAFGTELIDFACNRLAEARITKEERWLAQWVLGLTDKAFQNVLRDERNALVNYTNEYKETCRRIVENFERTHGVLSGTLEIESELKAEINTLFMVYLLNAIGSETLTIRGSEKSSYGKLFEKLILGSLLSILGFKLVERDNLRRLNKVFWLAEQGERRESDATLLYTAGKGVRFDIGFIGNTKWYLATIIIVDRIGKNSRIEKLARRIGGAIVQMSMSYWPKEVAHELNKVLGYSHKVLKLSDEKLENYLKHQVAKVPMEKIIGISE